MKAYSGEERRAFERVESKNVLVVCEGGRLGGLLGKKIGGGKPMPVDNISRTGLCFLSKDEIKADQEFGLTVDLGERRPTFKAEGRTVWCGKGEGRYAHKAGLCFTSFEPAVWKALSTLGERVTAKGGESWRLRSQDRAPQPLGHRQKAEETKRADAVAGIFTLLDDRKVLSPMMASLVPNRPAPSRPLTVEQEAIQEIARLDGYASTFDPRSNPLQAFLQLQEAIDEFGAVAPAKLGKAGEQQKAQLAARLRGLGEQVVSRWDPQTRTAAMRLARRTRQVRLTLGGILSALSAPDGTIGTADINKLATQIRTFRTLLASVPGTKPATIPIWRLLVAAGKAIVQPFVKNLFLLQCAIALSRADGQLAPGERDLLFGIADRIHLSRKEAGALIEQSRGIPGTTPKFSPEEALDIVHNLYVGAMTDGVVSRPELVLLGQLARTWGVSAEEIEGLLGERGRLNELITGARARLDRVLAVTSGRERGKAQDESVRVIDEVGALADVIAEIEQVAADMPDVRLPDMPGWDRLERAKEGVIKKLRSNILLLRAAVCLTEADGDVNPSERTYIDRIAEEIHLSRPEVDALIENPGEINWSEFEGTPADAQELVHRLHELAVADGEADEPEKRFFQEAIAGLGLTEADAADILGKPEQAQAVAFLDKEGAIKFLEAQRTLPARTLTLKRIRSDMEGRLKRQLGIPTGQQLLVCYENRSSGTVEAAALTGTKFFMRTPEARKEVFNAGLVDRCSVDEESARLELTDGRVIALSPAAGPFLELLVQCVKENIRKV